MHGRILLVKIGRNKFRRSGDGGGGVHPETGFLRQPALEGMTRYARTDSPRQKLAATNSGEAATAAAACTGRRRRGL
ncbi:hypothetical protein F511_37433 [Dorcoceras hygrometricum]|uniref:Uncharacterized protein n=1 Tax=Dorcoceras hygrometricum TaxID=472368 RepID=A0A2Z7D3S9_9LAMI|nr:hypothetical protein F511_37433 [Dorcoceras hygrometricum]